MVVELHRRLGWPGTSSFFLPHFSYRRLQKHALHGFIKSWHIIIIIINMGTIMQDELSYLHFNDRATTFAGMYLLNHLLKDPVYKEIKIIKATAKQHAAFV